MSKKRFLAKLCFISFLLGGNCNANPPKIAKFFWGQNIPKTAENLRELNGNGQPQINEIKYLIVKPDGIERCIVTIDNEWFNSEEYRKLSKVVGDTFDDKCIYCYDKFSESNDTCIKLNSETEGSQCDHLIHNDCFKTYGDDRKGVCPVDQKKVKKVYILLENGQNFDDENITRMAEGIKNLISDDDGMGDFHGARGIVRWMNENGALLAGNRNLINFQVPQLIVHEPNLRSYVIWLLIGSLIGGVVGFGIGAGSRLAAARILGNQASLGTLIRSSYSRIFSPNAEDGLAFLFAFVGYSIFVVVLRRVANRGNR